MTPIARKLLGILPIMVGLWGLCYPAPGVWQVKQIDFAWKYKERQAYIAKTKNVAVNPLLSPQVDPKGLEEFVDREVGSSREEVSGEAWETLFAQAEGTGSGPGRSGEYLYLPAGTAPLAAFEASAEESVSNRFIHSNVATVVHDGESVIETIDGKLYIGEESQFAEGPSAVIIRNVRFPEKMKQLVIPILLIKLAYIK